MAEPMEGTNFLVEIVVAFDLIGCWPSGYKGLSALDADGSAIDVERLTLEYVSWSRVR